MRYTVRLEKAAITELHKLPKEMFVRILNILEELEENPRHRNVKKLADMEGYRLRVGNYRVLFSIDDQARDVLVLQIKQRKDAYR